MVLLPWWLESTIHEPPARGFQRDIVYSSVCGYYFVRMIDDLMDGDRPVAPALLPILTFYHAEFQQTYYRYFPHGHPFWEACDAATMASAEMASRDVELRIGRARFLEISARKIARVGPHLGGLPSPSADRPDRSMVQPGRRVRPLAPNAQRHPGLDRDLEAGRRVLPLAGGGRRGRGRIRGRVGDGDAGVGAAQLEEPMGELLELAQGLGSPTLTMYLEERRTLLAIDGSSCSRA